MSKKTIENFFPERHSQFPVFSETTIGKSEILMIFSVMWRKLSKLEAGTIWARLFFHNKIHHKTRQLWSV